MLSKLILLKMFDFNYQRNTRVLDFAAKLSAEQCNAPQDIGRRTSLRETLFHILTVEEEWFYFCEHGVTNFGNQRLDAFPDVAALRTFSDQNYGLMLMYLENLDEEKLTATVTGQVGNDPHRTLSIWYILSHVLFHSTQHRSEVAEMLTRFGHSPSFIDFMNYDL